MFDGVCGGQAEAMGFKVGDRVVYSVFETYAEYTVRPLPFPLCVHTSVVYSRRTLSTR